MGYTSAAKPTETERLTEEQKSLYLERLEVNTKLEPNLETLRLLCIQHLKHIPFENLALHYVRTPPGIPSTDINEVFTKLIKRRRGGYCFELQKLFAALLTSLGFDVTNGLAAVYMGEDQDPPYTGLGHRITFVKLDGQTWLADVGFGAASMAYPMLISDTTEPFPNGVGEEYTHLEKIDDATWVLKHTYDLQRRPWRPTYKFTLDTFSEGENDRWNVNIATDVNLLTLNVIVVKLQEAGERLERLTLMNDKLHVSGVGKYELIEEFRSDQERVAGMRKWLDIELTDEESMGLANSKFGICPKE